MDEVVAILASWVLTTAAVFLALRLDEARMKPDQRARAWPVVSRASAVVVFGILCLPIHFWRTRRSVLGVLAGVGLAVLVGSVASMPEVLLELGALDLHASAIAETILAILALSTLLYVRVAS